LRFDPFIYILQNQKCYFIPHLNKNMKMRKIVLRFHGRITQPLFFLGNVQGRKYFLQKSTFFLSKPFSIIKSGFCTIHHNARHILNTPTVTERQKITIPYLSKAFYLHVKIALEARYEIQLFQIGIVLDSTYQTN